MTSIFNSIKSGGAAIYVRRLAQELAKNHQVFVISALSGNEGTPHKSNSIPDLVEIDSECTIPVYSLLGGSSCMTDKIERILWHSLEFWNFFAYLRIRKIFEKEKPDIVHTNTVKRFSPIIFSAIKQSGIPHVHTLHDYELISRLWHLFRNGKVVSHYNFFERSYIWYNRNISSSIQGVISPSKSAMEIHTSQGYFQNSKQFVIPHGIVSDNQSIVRKIFSKEFLYLGGMEEMKGPQIAISAFKKVMDEDARLHMVGKGSYLETLKDLAKEDKRIIFYGFRKVEELKNIFEKCSYLICPSISYETFGLTMIEAMSNGLPVIGSNIGSIPEIVKNGYDGFLFEAGNVNDLHSILEDLLKQKVPLSQLSKNALDESSEKYSMALHMKNITTIYSKIITSNK